MNPVVAQIPIGGQTFEVRQAQNGKYEVLMVDFNGKNAVHHSLHDSIDAAVTAIKAYAKSKELK